MIFSTASVVEFHASLYIMRLNRTSVWKVMTIWISHELPMFNFDRLDILRAWIWLPCKKSWPFEFFESFRCSISSVSIYYALESDLREKIYDHLNFSRASIVQFRASRYIMRLHLTSVWKFMTIWISRELPLFNFERLVILCAWMWPLCKKLWPFEFLEAFPCTILNISICGAPESDLGVKSSDHLIFSRASVVHFRASRYIMRLNLTSMWKGMTIWFLKSFRCSISSVSIYYAPESDLRVKSNDNLNFSRSSVVHFRASRYIMRLNLTSVWKLMTVWFLRSFRCSVSSISIYYAPQSDLRVKSNDHLNFSRAFVVQFWASRYIMRLNRTFE